MSKKNGYTVQEASGAPKTRMRKLALYVSERQLELPLMVMTIVMLGYLLNSDPQNVFGKLMFVSHSVSHDGAIRYGKGPWDLAFILYWIVAFSFIREFMMQHVLRSLGIRARVNKLTRFTEQSYVALYYVISSAVGLYIMRQSPYWFFNTREFWTDYPYIYLTFLEKSYYLMQSAFWLQQVVVIALQLEKPRKDFFEMFAHHIITCALIGLSYIGNCTRIGNAVFITMDFSDIWLAFAKCLKYMKLPSYVTDTTFAGFMVVWVYTRHYLYGWIIYSAYAEGCDPEINKNCRWDPLNGFWATRTSLNVMLVLLTALQGLMIYWFTLILKIAMRVTSGISADDTRSDSEEEDEDDIAPNGVSHIEKAD